MIVPAEDDERLARAAAGLARELADSLSGFHVTIGRSRRSADPVDLYRAGSEARLAVNVGEAEGRPLLAFEDTGAYRLLLPAMSDDPAELERFYAETIQPLADYDEQYETELVTTVEAYLDNDGNVAATAKQLFTHRHTVRYRLERVRELCGHDVSSTEGREKLGLGLKAMRVLGIASPRGPALEPGAGGGKVARGGDDCATLRAAVRGGVFGQHARFWSWKRGFESFPRNRVLVHGDRRSLTRPRGARGPRPHLAHAAHARHRRDRDRLHRDPDPGRLRRRRLDLRRHHPRHRQRLPRRRGLHRPRRRQLPRPPRLGAPHLRRRPLADPRAPQRQRHADPGARHLLPADGTDPDHRRLPRPRAGERGLGRDLRPLRPGHRDPRPRASSPPAPIGRSACWSAST